MGLGWLSGPRPQDHHPRPRRCQDHLPPGATAAAGGHREPGAAAIEAACPEAVRVTVTLGDGCRPVLTPVDHPGVVAACRAMKEVFGADAYRTRAGGSIAPSRCLTACSTCPRCWSASACPTTHPRPNEKFDVGQFQAGVRVLARLWDELAVSLPRRPGAEA